MRVEKEGFGRRRAARHAPRDRLERLLRPRRAVLVRVQLQDELAVRLFELVGRRGPLHAEQLVKVLGAQNLRHHRALRGRAVVRRATVGRGRGSSTSAGCWGRPAGRPPGAARPCAARVAVGVAGRRGLGGFEAPRARALEQIALFNTVCEGHARRRQQSAQVTHGEAVQAVHTGNQKSRTEVARATRARDAGNKHTGRLETLGAARYAHRRSIKHCAEQKVKKEKKTKFLHLFGILQRRARDRRRAVA